MPGLNTLLTSKKYGQDRVVCGLKRLQELKQTVLDFPRLPTYVFPFDYAVGGGLPLNTPVHVFGPFSGGKSTLAYLAARALSGTCMNPGCLRPFAVCRCDAPRKARTLLCQFEGLPPDESWFTALDYSPEENLVVALPDYGEQGFEIVEAALKADDCGLVIVDSMGAVTSRRELEGAYEDTIVGGSANLIGRFMRRATNVLVSELRRGHLVGLILINQLRSNVGATSFQPGEKTPGGWLLKHLCRLAIRLSQLSVQASEKDKDSNLQAVLRFSASLLGSEAKQQLFTAEGKTEYRLVIQDGYNGGYRSGAILDFKSVLGAAKEFDLLDKSADGYELVGLSGVKFKTLADLEEVFKKRGTPDVPHLDDVIRWYVLSAVREAVLEQMRSRGARIVLPAIKGEPDGGTEGL